MVNLLEGLILPLRDEADPNLRLANLDLAAYSVVRPAALCPQRSPREQSAVHDQRSQVDSK